MNTKNIKTSDTLTIRELIDILNHVEDKDIAVCVEYKENVVFATEINKKQDEYGVDFLFIS